VVVLTDAALPALADELAGRPTALPIDWQSVGGRQDNRAIVTLATRTRGGNSPVQVYARAANYGTAPVRTVLRLYGDDELLDTRAVNLEPNGEAELTWAVPRGAQMLRAELDGNDGLPTDDTASVSLDQTRPIRALLVSANPDALERALRAVPALELSTLDPIAYASSDADLTIFDGFLPEAWPDGGVLAIHPPPGSPLLAVDARERAALDDEALRITPGATLLDGVSLGTVDFGQVRTLTPPDGFRVLLSRGEQPLLLRGRSGASELAVWGFSLEQGNLTSRLAFPLLVARSVRDLTPAPPPATALLGETAALSLDPRTTRLEIGRPDGSVDVLDISSGELPAIRFEQPGVYVLVEQAADRTLYEGRMAVNAGAAVESDLAPRELPLAAAAGPAAAGSDDSQRSLWPWLAAVALATMILEWIYVHGRRRAAAEA
jgi:hypothetical protein